MGRARNSTRARRSGALALLAAGCLLLTLLPGSARATPQEEARGAELLRQIEAGQRECANLSAAEFELIGKYAMGRMFATPRQHEAMNQMMARMMGGGGEARVHDAMGRRYAGCGGARLPRGFGQMMGAVGAMGMMGGGMMGGDGYRVPGSMMGGDGYGAPGSMMGGANGSGDADFDGPSAAAMAGMMAVLIGAAAGALLWFGRRRHRSPLDALEERFAQGDLSAEEYDERRRLLEGGAR